MTEDKNGETTDESADEATEEASDTASEETSEDSDTGADANKANKAKKAPKPSQDEPEFHDERAAIERVHVDSAHIHTNAETIETIFTGKGGETAPGDPAKSPEWREELGEPVKNQTSIKVLLLTLVGVAVVLGIGFAVLPAELKTDAVHLLQGRDIIEERELREQARIEEERRQLLEAAPKFGTVEIVTSPNNLLITSPGQADMVFPGTRTDLTYPTRSRVTYQDISVTEDFSFTIHGEGNFQDKTYVIPAFGQADSPWAQSYTGDYTASLTFMACWPGQPARVEEKYCIYPATDVEWRARELQWRANWRPDPADDNPEAIIRLPGTITVSTDPVGALIAFNGRQLVNEAELDPETGAPAPIVTPHSFANYPAPPDHEDRTPLEVYLSREGLPLQVLYDGKASATMGVYMHQFVCNLKPGATPPAVVPADAPEGTPPANWLGLCDYTYSVNLTLSDPKPPESDGSGSGDGSGAAAPAAPAAPAEGSGQ